MADSATFPEKQAAEMENRGFAVEFGFHAVEKCRLAVEKEAPQSRAGVEQWKSERNLGEEGVKKRLQGKAFSEIT